MILSERIYIFDTTLRDGAQMEGVTFSLEDKLDIINRLDSLGVDFIEGGMPSICAPSRSVVSKM